MATPTTPKPALPAGPIERYFEVSLFLLVVTGFLTLVSTGRLDPLSLAMVSLALIGRGYLLLRNRAAVIPEKYDTALTLSYLLFYAADYFLISDSFVTASVHLVLFSLVVKLFSVRRDRDYLYLSLLSFLSVLAAAVLTVDTVFLAAFSIFLLLCITTFVSFEMRRSAMSDPHRATAPRVPSRVMNALTSAGVVLMLAILVGSVVLFFVLPRLSAGYLSSLAPHNEFSSGFSDHVELGEIGQIKQTDNVVMHIAVEGDVKGGRFSEMKWRGIALNHFDGKIWSNPASQENELAPGSASSHYDLLGIQIKRHNLNPYTADYRRARSFSYRVVMEPIGTAVIFLAYVPWQVQTNVREISVDDSGSVFNADHFHLVDTYRAFALLPQPSAADLRAAKGTVPHDIVLADTGLPENVDPRVQQLTETVTAEAATAYEKAAAIEQFLRTQYSYTLFMGPERPKDPISYFLFERKQGHCEYFASAMAVMLRTIGIPSRVVNGFRGGQYNDLTGQYIIRGRDAHSWVEAYIPGYQWITFDPTPPDPRPVISPEYGRFLLYLDAAKEFWREWVINYDFMHQRTLGTAASSGGRRMAFDLQRWIREQYHGLVRRAFRMHRSMSQNPWQWSGGALGGCLLILLLALSPLIWRTLRRNSLARNPRRAPQQAASIWYGRMTRALARRGLRKLPSQTAEEFAREIDDELLRGPVQAFTEHYERARFGASAEDAGKLPELYEEISAKK